MKAIIIICTILSLALVLRAFSSFNKTANRVSRHPALYNSAKRNKNEAIIALIVFVVLILVSLYFTLKS